MTQNASVETSKRVISARKTQIDVVTNNRLFIIDVSRLSFIHLEGSLCIYLKDAVRAMPDRGQSLRWRRLDSNGAFLWSPLLTDFSKSDLARVALAQESYTSIHLMLHWHVQRRIAAWQLDLKDTAHAKFSASRASWCPLGRTLAVKPGIVYITL